MTRVSVGYHMTKLEKVTMSEKRDLVGLMAELSRRIGEKHPWGTVGVFNHVSFSGLSTGAAKKLAT